MRGDVRSRPARRNRAQPRAQGNFEVLRCTFRPLSKRATARSNHDARGDLAPTASVPASTPASPSAPPPPSPLPAIAAARAPFPPRPARPPPPCLSQARCARPHLLSSPAFRPIRARARPRLDARVPLPSPHRCPLSAPSGIRSDPPRRDPVLGRFEAPQVDFDLDDVLAVVRVHSRELVAQLREHRRGGGSEGSIACFSMCAMSCAVRGGGGGGGGGGDRTQLCARRRARLRRNLTSRPCAACRRRVHPRRCPRAAAGVDASGTRTRRRSSRSFSSIVVDEVLGASGTTAVRRDRPRLLVASRARRDAGSPARCHRAL